MRPCLAYPFAIVALGLLAGAAAVTVGVSQRPEEPVMPVGEVRKPVAVNWPRNIDPLHVVVVFTKFKGEAPEVTASPSWTADMFNGRPGSVNDYFTAVTFGQCRVTGEFLPRMYEMPYDSTYYRTSELYTADIIRMLDEDPSLNLAKYDNDGPDRIPNSGDDDGYVDYLVLMPISRPYNFIVKLATGAMTLSLPEPYMTHDLRPFGERIIVDKYSGCIAVARTKIQAIPTIVAEIAHAYGAVDLMDKEYSTLETDSAGAGFWDVLAWGANGWGWSGIPSAPCAYNRMLMNSIGTENTNLVDLYGVREDVRMKPSGDPDGKVYRINVSLDEYFLIEFRSNSGSLYYDSQIPKSGLLIWHIIERESNAAEELKLCDLECADGKYRDAGYPKGQYPNPLKGGDNLDFWAHDADYAEAHCGNLGDATDVYDGERYTGFGTTTNPNSYSDVMRHSTGIEIFNIHRNGDEMAFSCSIAYNPVVKPPKLPIVGVGFQRSKGRTPVADTTPAKAAYLVGTGTGMQPDLLVTLAEDTLTTFDASSLSRSALQRTVESFLLGGEDPQGAEIIRENIPPEEFERTLRDYAVKPDDLTAVGVLRRVQKLSVRTFNGELPMVMKVGQNYPNPFNSETVIPYILSRSGPVTLDVFDILGRKVLNLNEGYRGAGSHITRISSERLASGVYFYRFRGAAFSETRRFVIVR